MKSLTKSIISFKKRGMYSHVLTQFRIFAFTAPGNRRITPNPVREGMETVEILTDGTVYFDWNGERRAFHRGTVFWHIPGERTVWETPPEDPYRCYNFTFKVTRANRPVPRVSVWRDMETLAPFCSEVLRAFVLRPEEHEILAHYCYAALRWHSVPLKPAGTEQNPFLVRALRFLRENCGNPVSVEDLLATVKVSRPYLFRLFREELHCSPHQYLLKLRLDKAKELLVGESLTLKEIAARCGFASQEVFFRQFRKSMQITPSEYRRSYSRPQ